MNNLDEKVNQVTNEIRNAINNHAQILRVFLEYTREVKGGMHDLDLLEALILNEMFPRSQAREGMELKKIVQEHLDKIRNKKHVSDHTRICLYEGSGSLLFALCDLDSLFNALEDLAEYDFFDTCSRMMNDLYNAEIDSLNRQINNARR